MGQIFAEKYGNGLYYFFDIDDKKHYYGRVVGGIGWRGKQPGFIIAVGEDLDKDVNLDVYHRWILREYEDFDTVKLLNQALSLRESAKVKPFVGDSDNEIEGNVLSKINEKINYRSHLSIEWAPHSADPKAFEFYLNTIERSLNPHKILHFGESKARQYLNEVNPDNRNKLNVGDYPALTALGCALEYLDTHDLDINRGIGNGNDDDSGNWDPLRWGL